MKSRVEIHRFDSLPKIRRIIDKLGKSTVPSSSKGTGRQIVVFSPLTEIAIFIAMAVALSSYFI